VVVIITFLYFFPIVGFVGVADALFDFRKLDVVSEEK
jgi:hypothetical protein